MSRPLRKDKGFKAFAKGFSGTLLAPEDPGYDAARAVHNAMVDKRPALIAQCRSPDDVSLALAFARDRDAEIAVRAGGHSVAGMSATDGGVVVDVRPMRRVTVDPVARTARVGAGATWADFDGAAQNSASP